MDVKSQRLHLLFFTNDADGDGVLSLEEFGALLNSALPAHAKPSEKKTEALFLEALEFSEQMNPEQADSILPEAFTQVGT